MQRSASRPIRRDPVLRRGFYNLLQSLTPPMFLRSRRPLLRSRQRRASAKESNARTLRNRREPRLGLKRRDLPFKRYQSVELKRLLGFQFPGSCGESAPSTPPLAPEPTRSHSANSTESPNR